MWSDSGLTTHTRRRVVRLVFYLALSFFLMVADTRFQFLAPLRSAFATLAYPLQIAATWPSILFEGASSWLSSLATLHAENKSLKNWQLDHAWLLNNDLSLRKENDDLRQLLGLRTQQYPTATAAEIIGFTQDGVNRIALINKGNQAGVSPGQGVVSTAGVLGQVTRTYPFHSEVFLINHPKHSTSIMFERIGLFALGLGDSEGRLKVPYVPLKTDVQKDDLLVTSGLDGIFPPGLPVGRITSLNKDDSGYFYELRAMTEVDLTQRNVLVLAPFPLAADSKNEIDQQNEAVKALSSRLANEKKSRSSTRRKSEN